jgi:hypothetical protein
METSNRDIKGFVAVTTLVIAIFIGLNEIIAPGRLTEWAGWIGAGLLLLSAAFFAWIWVSDRAVKAEEAGEAEMSAALQLPQASPEVKEWAVKKVDVDVPAAPVVETDGEVAQA